MTLNVRNFLVGLVNIVLAITTLFLGLRIVFRLFSANTSTPFVSWIYQMSDGFVAPFAGMFPNFSVNNGMVVDVVAIISLVVYSLVAYLIITLIDTLLRPAVVNESVTHQELHAHDIDHTHN